MLRTSKAPNPSLFLLCKILPFVQVLLSAPVWRVAQEESWGRLELAFHVALLAAPRGPETTAPVSLRSSASACGGVRLMLITPSCPACPFLWPSWNAPFLGKMFSNSPKHSLHRPLLSQGIWRAAVRHTLYTEKPVFANLPLHWAGSSSRQKLRLVPG